MKYTRRADHEDRANHRFTIALTREELQDYNARAKKLGYESFRKFFQGRLGSVFLIFEDEWYDFEQEKGNE